MKHARKALLAVLLIALLLSGCGQMTPAAAPETVESSLPAVQYEAAAPSGGYYLQPLSGFVSSKPSAIEREEAGRLFRAKFEGNEVNGSGEAVDGVYRFIATQTDGEAWHVKLESNYPTVAGRDYRVSYRFRSDVAGKIKFGDFQEYDIAVGENEVTGIMIAAGGTSYFDLQLGMLPPFTIDFTEIEVKEYSDDLEYEDALPKAIDFENEMKVYEKHDQGFAPIPTREKDAISINYFSVPWDTGIWKSRLYVKTGLIPEAGVRYRVTADLSCDQDMDFEVLFNNGDEEKGYGALYGQTLSAGEVTSCEAVISGSGDGDELVLQFSLGEAPEDATVKLSNVNVEKITDHYTRMLPAGFALDKSVATGKMLSSATPVSSTELPLTNFSWSGTDTVYEGHDDDYVVSLEESATSATLNISQAPASDRGVWKVRLFAATGLTLEAGTKYRIKFDLKSTRDQAKYEVLFSGDSDEAYGADKNRSLTAGGTDHVEYLVTPDASHGPLTLRLQLGETNSTAGNSVTLSNLSVEKLTSTYQEVGTVYYGGASTADFWAEHAYTGAGGAVLTKNGGTVRLQIKQPPADGREAWKVKLFVNNVAALSAGKTYRVSADVSATAAFDYELCYNDAVNGGGEKKLGELYGLHAEPTAKTVSYDVKPTADATLNLQFNLGLASAPTTLSVSNVQVREVTASADAALGLSLAYPVTSGGTSTHVDDAWAAQTLNLSAGQISWADSAAQATVQSVSSAQLVITEPSHEADAPWTVRLHVGTGVTPKPGKQYKVEAKFSATAPTGNWECKLSNGPADVDGAYPNQYGSGYAYVMNSGDQNVTIAKTFEVPADLPCSELVLRFDLGRSGTNTITVSDIKVSEFVPAHDEVSEATTDPKSFILEPNAAGVGSEAVLTGTGTSAKVTVKKPGTEDWHIKLLAQTGVSFEAGKSYRVDLKVEGAGGWNICYKYPTGDDRYFSEVKFEDGLVKCFVTPTEAGAFELLLKLGKLAQDGTVTVSGITVTQLGGGETLGDNLAPATLGDAGYWTHEDYGKVDAGALSAEGSTAKLEIKAPPAEGREAWKVKLFLNTGIALKAGKEYRISADVSSTAAMDYEICYTNGVNDLPENQVAPTKGGLHAAPAAQTVICDAAPGTDATLSLQLNLGCIPAPGAVTVSKVKVEECLGETAENLLPDFRYNSVGSVSSAADEGYLVSLDKADASAAFQIHQAPAERNPWNVKLNLRTGFTPESGKAYRVSFDIEADRAQSVFEVNYDGSAEGAYGELRGKSLSAGKQTVSALMMPRDSKGELSIQIRLGKTDGTNGNRYTVSNLKLEEVTLRYTQTPETKDVTTLDAQPGYVEHLEKSRDRATVRVEKTPSEGREPWKSKLFVETGVTLKEGEKYRVSFDVKSVIPTPFEACFNNGGEEKGLGAIFGLIATPSGQYVEYVTYPKQDTQLVLQLSLGNCTAPNTIVLGNVMVEKAGAIELVSDTVYTF